MFIKYEILRRFILIYIEATSQKQESGYAEYRHSNITLTIVPLYVISSSADIQYNHIIASVILLLYTVL